MTNKYDSLDRSLDDLLADRHPREFEVEVPEDVDLLKVAALLKASSPNSGAPEPAFVRQLEERLERESHPEPASQSATRRRLLLGGLASAAASLLAGVGLDRVFRREAPTILPPQPDPDLVGNLGHWFQVAHVDQVRPGAIMRVRAGAVDGFLMHRDGAIIGMSAVCTHMACVLSWRQNEDDLFCPCHGASYNTDGTIKRSRIPYKPLPPLRVKVEGEMVFLWAVDDVTPSA